MLQRKIKIGVDVGGTFTHAVAIDISRVSVIGKACVPTTHTAKEGVAAGVIQSLQHLLLQSGIAADEVVLIAHSTTQATNALLEGDVATVGVVIMGRGLEGRLGFRQVTAKPILLNVDKALPVHYRYLDMNEPLHDDRVRVVIEELIGSGAQVIVASELYGIDHPEPEQQVAHIAESMGLLTPAASAISQLYGMQIRTRTAIINAAMLPKMLETADLTEQSIRRGGITAPLMIMRSDGGIMDIREMRRRPILTILSGPAAGVAAALMYARVTDGVFIEVGGTSSDISVIKNGKPQIRSAQVGGNRLHVRTLDIRTLGIGGGSMARLSGRRIHDVGPRSAHIAGVHYPAYSSEDDFSDIEIATLQPRPGDPNDYILLQNPRCPEQRFALTPSEAGAWLRSDTAVGHGAANRQAVSSLLQALANKWSTTAADIARAIADLSAKKIESTVLRLLREYKLNRELVRLVGGGGGAPALVPFVGQRMQLPYDIAENCEVISAIGVALGIIRDSIERSIVNPSEADLIAMRREVMGSVQSMGAAPETIEVAIQVDNKNKRVIAVATGSTEFKARDSEARECTTAELLQIAAPTLRADPEQLSMIARTDFLLVVALQRVHRRFFGLFEKRISNLRIMDRFGVIRLQLNSAVAAATTPSNIKTEIQRVVEELTSYGDAGALLPDLYILAAGRIIDLTGLVQVSQILAVVDIELQSLSGHDDVVLVGARKS